MFSHGLLPDHEIRRLGHEIIEPFDEARVQPASYDLSLHPDILVPQNPRPASPVDLRTDSPRDMIRAVRLGDGYELMPGACIIASTAEIIRCPNDIAARVEGKSSLGRLFLAVHVTAGWIDPGWSGQVTLELVNHGPWSIMLWPGMKIAQINFTRMGTPCSVPYGSASLKSHYQGQVGPQPAVGRRASEVENRVQTDTLEKVDRWDPQ